MIFDRVIDDESDWEISYIEIRIFSHIEREQGTRNGWNPSRWGRYHMCDFQSGLFDTQSWYRQTLLGSDQSGNDSRNFTVKMTVNGFLNIQKLKFRKIMNLMTEARHSRTFWIWGVQTVRGDALVRTDVWNVFWSPLNRFHGQKRSNGHITVGSTFTSQI